MDNSVHNKLLLSTAYFPTLEYFKYMLKYKDVKVDIHETYPKQTWRNRCRILSANGPIDLIIPVKKPNGKRTKTSEVIISPHYLWQRNHWRAIESAYRNAPYYIYYKDMVESLVMNSMEYNLYEFNQNVLVNLMTELGINKTVEFTQSFVSETIGIVDMRFCLSPKAKDRKNRTDISFKPYYQIFADKYGFQSNLSIIDLLFNSGPDSTEYLQNTI